MESVIASLLIGLINAVPKVVEAIQNSSTMSEDEKKLLLAHIQDELDAASKRVSDVKFRDVDGQD